MINKHEIEAIKKYLCENKEDTPRIARSFLEDAIPMLELRIAKKIIIEGRRKEKVSKGDYVDYKCPTCGKRIASAFHYLDNEYLKEHEHCERCGQAIDWNYQ